MTKKELRKLYTEKRRSLSERDRLKADDLFMIRFQQLGLGPVEVVHSYTAFGDKQEFDTSHIIRFLQFQNPGLVQVVPRIIPETFVMEHIRVEEDTEFELSQYGIPEPVSGAYIDPESIDLILVPLLCFDARGYRVGYGKGYYDRFLAGCRPDAIKLGFSYFEPIAAIRDAADFDVPLNFCITPDTIYEF